MTSTETTTTKIAAYLQTIQAAALFLVARILEFDPIEATGVHERIRSEPPAVIAAACAALDVEPVGIEGLHGLVNRRLIGLVQAQQDRDREIREALAECADMVERGHTAVWSFLHLMRDAITDPEKDLDQIQGAAFRVAQDIAYHAERYRFAGAMRTARQMEALLAQAYEAACALRAEHLAAAEAARAMVADPRPAEVQERYAAAEAAAAAAPEPSEPEPEVTREQLIAAVERVAWTGDEATADALRDDARPSVVAAVVGFLGGGSVVCDGTKWDFFVGGEYNTWQDYVQPEADALIEAIQARPEEHTPDVIGDTDDQVVRAAVHTLDLGDDCAPIETVRALLQGYVEQQRPQATEPEAECCSDESCTCTSSGPSQSQKIEEQAVDQPAEPEVVVPSYSAAVDVFNTYRTETGATYIDFDVANPDAIEIIEKRVAKLATDAEKAGVSAPLFETLGTRMVDNSDGTAHEVTQCRVSCYLDNRINGWELRARLLRTDEGNLVERIDVDERDATPIPAKYRDTGMVDHCDRCGCKRNRNEAWLCHNTDTDEWAQLGGSCLSEHLGFGTYSQMRALLRLRDKVAKTIKDPALVKRVAEKQYTGVSTLLILTYIAASIREKGWKDERSMSPTYIDGLSRYHLDRHVANSTPVDQLGSVARPYKPTDEDRQAAREALSWAAGITDEQCSELGGDTLGNYRVIANNTQVATRDLHWSARLVRHHQIETTEKADADEAVSATVARPGDLFGQPVDKNGRALPRTQGSTRHPSLAAKVIMSRTITTKYGPRRLVKFQTDDGCTLVWWAPLSTWDRCGMRDGRTYWLNCLIKRHGAYNGKPQTDISWVSSSGEADANRTPQQVAGDFDGRVLEIDPKAIAERAAAVQAACDVAIEANRADVPDFAAVAAAAKANRAAQEAAKKALR